MNDRCAAGTGKFIEVVARKFDCSPEEVGALALGGADGIRIHSCCAVFAESEIIGLLSRGCAVADIARALHRSVVNRITTMFSRVEAEGPVAITGGGANNVALIELFRESLAPEIWSSGYSQMAGALGCAVSGSNHGPTRIAGA
jgi:predicted CoA-substrate-specific enzyme activase